MSGREVGVSARGRGFREVVLLFDKGIDRMGLADEFGMAEKGMRHRLAELPARGLVNAEAMSGRFPRPSEAGAD